MFQRSSSRRSHRNSSSCRCTSVELWYTSLFLWSVIKLIVLPPWMSVVFCFFLEEEKQASKTLSDRGTSIISKRLFFMLQISFAAVASLQHESGARLVNRLMKGATRRQEELWPRQISLMQLAKPSSWPVVVLLCQTHKNLMNAVVCFWLDFPFFTLSDWQKNTKFCFK